MKRAALCLAALVASSATDSRAAEIIPPKPAGYFNDYASVVSKEAAHRFNEELAQFERETSNQVVVAVFPKMQSDSSIEDYTQRVAQSWGVGQKDRRNGVVLFVFIGDRKMFIRVGYGLEGALPNITAFDIIEHQIKPHFRNGDYQGGLGTGIDVICKATRDAYKGSGKTVAEQRASWWFPELIPFQSVAAIAAFAVATWVLIIAPLWRLCRSRISLMWQGPSLSDLSARLRAGKNAQMKTFFTIFLVILAAAAVIFGGLAVKSRLDNWNKAKSSSPPSLTSIPSPPFIRLLKPVTVQGAYATITLQAGTSVPFVSRDGNNVRFHYQNTEYEIPVDATDLAK